MTNWRASLLILYWKAIFLSQFHQARMLLLPLLFYWRVHHHQYFLLTSFLHIKVTRITFLNFDCSYIRHYNCLMMEFLFKYPRNWSSPKFTLRQACNGTNLPNYKLWSHHYWGSKHALLPRYCDKWLSPLQNIRKLFFMLKNTVPSSKVKTITSICWRLFPLILFRNIYLLYFSFPCVIFASVILI